MEEELCQRMGIPVEREDPIETWRQLMSTRNEWKLYRRPCDKTGKIILSAYPEKTPFPVYSNAEWWGDGWDALAYGREFDFNRPFFEQFIELRNVVPREGTSIVKSENCDYNSHTRESKNCYLNSLTVQCEDVYYSYWMVGSKDCMDSLLTHKSSLCYECRDVQNGYGCVMIENARDSSDCFFSYDLRNCNHCIFSSNLVNKSYQAFNKSCSKEEFEHLKETYLNGSWAAWEKAVEKFLKLREEAVHRYAQIINGENVTGDRVYNSKNCINCFDAYESEDCSNAISVSQSKNIARTYSLGWTGSELVYKSCVTRGSIDIAYCMYTWWCHRMRYTDSCASCEDCFGCIGLRHKKYCILNKQYSQQEYETLTKKIIEHMKKTGEWGQFLPKGSSVFAYNESAANDYFPLTREEALAQGYRWKEEELKKHLPPIPNELLLCERCHTNHRLIPQELKFYKKLGLPIPKNCPQCRHKARFGLLNPYRLQERTCTQCHTPIQSTYAPDRLEKVFCENCYLNTVY